MNELYAATIFTLELIYKYIYLALISLIGSYGLSLLALSLLNYFLLIPLNKLVRGLQVSENNIQEVLEPQLKKIKESSQNAERHQRTQHLYQRYSYHPIFAIRSVFPLLVQLPFLMAVYFMVSSLSDLNGVSFLFLKDLAAPDGLLWGYNMMPLVMTFVSLLNACYIVKLSSSQKKQAVIVALLFLVLLYNAPSALLVYWTMNNVVILAFGLLSRLSPIMKLTSGLSTMKQKLLPSLLESSGLLLALSFVTPLYFTVGLNLNFFTEIQIANFVVFISIVAGTCILLGIVLDKLIQISSVFSISISWPFSISIRKNAEKIKSSLRIKIVDIFYIFLALSITFCISALCINIRLYLPNGLTINIFRLALALSLFFIIRKFRFKIANICMLSILVFCGFQFAQVQYRDIQASETTNSLIDKAHSSFPLNEKLDAKPNIYLVYLESYMNSKTLRDTYQFDNSAFENKLNEQGFQIYDNVFSHSLYTKASLLNLVLMQNDVSPLFVGKSDLIYRGHDILGGSPENVLFKYLKNNNYTISTYYDDQAYYFKRKGDFLDHTINKIDNSLLSLLREIAPSLNHKVEIFQRVVLRKNIPASSKDIYPKSYEYLADIKERTTPTFFLLKPFNDLHNTSPCKEVSQGYRKWISYNIYQQGVAKMNNELLLLIAEIEKNDPSALIILIGDHGHKFTGSAEGDIVLESTPKHIVSAYPQLQISSKEIIEDLFSVFLAIKMPESAKGSLAIDAQFAYADLFRHIFTALDNNPNFLINKSADISINNSKVIIREGDSILEDGKIAK